MTAAAAVDGSKPLERSTESLSTTPAEADESAVDQPARVLLGSNLKQSKAGGVGAARFSRHITDFVHKDKNAVWKSRQQEKQRLKTAKELEASMKQERSRKLRQRNEQRRVNEERRKERELRSGQVQVIKNASKVRKWSLKARRTLAKLAPEFVEQLLARK